MLNDMSVFTFIQLEKISNRRSVRNKGGKKNGKLFSKSITLHVK